jgi:peroxiredoxin family protein
MDLIFVCRDALMNSAIANIGLALEAKKAGMDAGVLFTEEALYAVAGESFRWSPLFQGRDIRAKISKNATATGIEVGNQKDSRWTDLSRLLDLARGKGVQLLACPLWVQILDLKERIPSQLVLMEKEVFFKELKGAKVIGGF